MNERIKELEDQCWVKVPCDFDMDAGGLSTIRTVFDRKKFAELIVRECLDIIRRDAKNFRECDIKTDLVVVEEYNKTFKYIQQHFGVKE